MNNSLLFEVSWEVANQVGGIYTVLRSKLPAVLSSIKNEYYLIGPYLKDDVYNEFEEIECENIAIKKTISELATHGIFIKHGIWLVTGRPKILLVSINEGGMGKTLFNMKESLEKDHKIYGNCVDSLLNQSIIFGFYTYLFFKTLNSYNKNKKIVAHFHEWLAGVAIPQIKKENLNISIVFTTHATILGRYLAMNSENFYQILPFFDWEKEARHFGILPQVQIERSAAHNADTFTTVSNITANECKHLLGKEVDLILPNGINIEKFEMMYEMQNLHKTCKEKIHELTMAHFFPSYSFDLKNTLYFFTSGRYEYKNKGYDLTLEALARLNWRMKEEGINKTVVMFLVTKKPYYAISSKSLYSRAILDNIQSCCDKIQKQIGDKLFYQIVSNAKHEIPDLASLIDETSFLNLKRALFAWKSKELPPMATHSLIDKERDEVLNFLNISGLNNKEENKVKVIYHPDFISATNPIDKQDYDQFVRGCHLGIFPSYYEPWGYTPLECMARGVPTITSNLTGFGDYIEKHMPKAKERGVFVIDRVANDFNMSAEQLTNLMLEFVKTTTRERIKYRNRVENAATSFDWKVLIEYYQKAYKHSLK